MIVSWYYHGSAMVLRCYHGTTIDIIIGIMIGTANTIGTTEVVPGSTMTLS